jgi:predicted SpoU family rRNA methylase
LSLISTFCSQSNELKYEIDQILHEHSGQYICEALNDFGGQQNEITITVVTAPRVNVKPEKVETEENSSVTFECSVGNTPRDEKCSFSWLLDRKVLGKVSGS